MGWRISGSLPNQSKFVVIAAPHTSNWDFVVGLAAAMALDVDAHWIGKHTIFRWPFGPLMRHLGGIPVNRSATSGLVEQIVERFANSEGFVLGLAPEGTRKHVSRWKSGFYHIAAGAGVPIVCGYFDFEAKEVGIGPVIDPSGDYEADLDMIVRFYAPIRGKRSKGRPMPAS
jgi:1-acyl-sn-glycerol-3-phosphate acyltransferase